MEFLGLGFWWLWKKEEEDEVGWKRERKFRGFVRKWEEKVREKGF